MELQAIGQSKKRLSPIPSPNQPSSPKPVTRHWHYSWQSLQPALGSSPAPRSIPRSRNSHATCAVSGYLYLLGGKDGTVSHKDMWRYNTGLESWEEIKGTGDKPFSLQGHTMTVHGSKLYIFGGKFNCGSDDESPFWIFDTETNIWEKNKQPADVMTPMGRREHTAVIHQGAFYIYGGYVDLKGSSSELWSFNFVHNMWHLCYCTALVRDGPGGRHAHSAVVHNNNMWVFGGMNDLQAKDDLWKWNFGVQRWTRIRAKGPPALKDHSACKLGEKMFIFGGLCDGQLHNQLWTFHLVSHTWTKVAVPGISPPASIKHSAVLISSADVTNLVLANQSDRCFSSPQLGGAQPQLSLEQTRPFSSPPSVLVTDAAQKVSRNRIVPTSSGHATTSSTQECNPAVTLKFNNPMFDANISSDSSPGRKGSVVPQEEFKPLSNSSRRANPNKLKKQSEWGSAGSVLRYNDSNALIDMRTSQTFSDTDSFNSAMGLGVSNPTFTCDTRGQFVRVRRSSETLTDHSTPDVAVPMKRHRYSSQFSDDFVPYHKSASAESILSSHSRILPDGIRTGQGDASGKSQSMGSLNNHMSGCELSEGFWDAESRSTSRDDLVLEDIEDCGSELFDQASANVRFNNAPTLMDWDIDCVVKPPTTHNNHHSLHLRPSQTDRLLQKCTHQSLVCLHEPAVHDVDMCQAEQNTANVAKDHNENPLISKSPRSEHNSVDCVPPAAETSFISEKRSIKLGGKNASDVDRFKEFFVRNSHIAENKYFMFILGGKTREAQHLQIKPLPIWKLEVDIV